VGDDVALLELDCNNVEDVLFVVEDRKEGCLAYMKT
jgi:hypothetical protein